MQFSLPLTATKCACLIYGKHSVVIKTLQRQLNEGSLSRERLDGEGEEEENIVFVVSPAAGKV